MKRNPAKHLLALSFLLFFLVSCQSSDPICESSFLADADYENVCVMSVRQNAKQAELHLKADLKSGGMKWSLTDPAGKVMWEGAGTAGQGVDQAQTFSSPTPGSWRLSIVLDDAEGSYSAPWTVQ